MHPLFACKHVPVIQSQAIKDNTLFVGSHGSTPVNIDTKGFAAAVIVFMYGASDIAMAALSIYESDDTTDGNFAIIASSNYATSGIGTLPSSTEDNLLFGWKIPSLGTARKRYLRINAMPGDGSTGSYAAAYAVLGPSEVGIDTASEAGFSQFITVT